MISYAASTLSACSRPDSSIFLASRLQPRPVDGAVDPARAPLVVELVHPRLREVPGLLPYLVLLAHDRAGQARQRARGGEHWIGYTGVDSSGRGARDGRAVYEGPQAPEAFHRRVQEADSRPPQRRRAQARGHGRVRPRQEHRGEAGQVDKRDRLAARRGQPHARAEPDPGARAREPQAPDGGRHLKTSGAGIRSKVRAIAANEGRYPISAQCGLLGVARSTYYSMRSRPDRPAAPAVVAAHASSKGRYGPRKIKASPGRPGVTVSRRRACRVMGENGPVGACGGKRSKVHPEAADGAAHPYMRRPGLRARRGLVELHPPARRPPQQGDRRPLRRAREGRPAGQVGVRDALPPHLGHRGIPHGPRQRVRQRRDRPDARGLQHREVTCVKISDTELRGITLP